MCTEEIQARLLDPQLFLTWKTSTEARLNTLSQTTGVGADTTKNAGILPIETEITAHMACLREKLADTEATPSEVLALQKDYAAAEKELAEAEKDVSISKERTALLRNPERKVTVYEGWFPIHRPLTTGSALLLVGLTLFMICLVLAYVSNQMGLFVDIGLVMNVPGPDSVFSRLLRQVTPLTGGIFLVALGLLGGLIYSVRK